MPTPEPREAPKYSHPANCNKKIRGSIVLSFHSRAVVIMKPFKTPIERLFPVNNVGIEIKMALLVVMRL